VLGRIGQAQYAAQYLFDIHPRGLVGQRCENVGERTIPALFQRIDRNDVTHRTVVGQQVGVSNFVFVRRFDFYLVFGNADFDKFAFDFVERNIVVIGFRLRLEQHNRANVSAALRFHCDCLLFQTALHLYRTRNNIARRTVIVHDYRQLYHVGSFEFHGIYETDDIALLAGRRRQVEDETRIDCLEHIHMQVGLEVVTFVDDDDRIQIRQHLNQSRFVRPLHAFGHRIVEFGILRQILVFAIDSPSVLVVGGERLHAQHENRQLLANLRRMDAMTEQCRLFVYDAHGIPEMAVDFLPVRMRRIS